MTRKRNLETEELVARLSGTTKEEKSREKRKPKKPKKPTKVRSDSELRQEFGDEEMWRNELMMFHFDENSFEFVYEFYF